MKTLTPYKRHFHPLELDNPSSNSNEIFTVLTTYSL
ncbi:unnamed protein product, partial [Larinioides sclopetarius]